MIRLSQVSKSFPLPGGREVQALADVSLDIPKGQFTVLLGPSGCGKTTILRLIAGLDGPTAGTVEVDGESVRGPSWRRGMVFQSYSLLPWLRVRENILLGVRFRGVREGEDIDSRLNELLELMELENFAQVFPSMLSGGMKQRVAIARTLLSDPDILLLDEPFGALDSQTRELMQEELLRVWDQLDKTVVFVTHDLEEAIFLADQVCVLSARPAQIRWTKEVAWARPRSPELRFQQDFLELRRRIREATRVDAIETIRAR